MCVCVLAFLDALPHLCQHVNLGGGDSDSLAILRDLIGLIEDPDPSVRTLFSQSVRFLLAEPTSEPDQDPVKELLVSRVKEAFSKAKLNRDDELRSTLILTTGEIGR